MSKTIKGRDVVRAWKDADYRERLSAADRAALPNHPAGLVDLSDAELESVHGALPTQNCIPQTNTGADRCSFDPVCPIRISSLMHPCQFTFAAPDPGDGCQMSVNGWTCTDQPHL